MKKMALFVAAGFLCKSVQAQQKPHYTQYILNQYILNPALTGIENYVDVKLSHRHQWVGLEGAPVTTYATVHAPLGKQDFRTTATSYRVPGENPRGRSYWQEYTAAEPHHGIGAQVINDRTGPLNSFSAYVTYAYHIGIGVRTSLAAGFGAGITNLSLNGNKLDFGPANPVDPAVFSSGAINNIKPDFTAGLYVYSADYFIGLSAQQIIPQQLVWTDQEVNRIEDGKFVPHLFATAGYRFLLTEELNVIPSVLVKYIKPLPVQAEVNAKLQYLDLVWTAVSYRLKDGFAGMLGVNISNSLNVGYAYDYTTSGLNAVSRGTHEFMVGCTIGNRYGDWCPKNVW